eukprot:3938942-Rhodomonas_salina.2
MSGCAAKTVSAMRSPLSSSISDLKSESDAEGGTWPTLKTKVCAWSESPLAGKLSRSSGVGSNSTSRTKVAADSSPVSEGNTCTSSGPAVNGPGSSKRTPVLRRVENEIDATVPWRPPDANDIFEASNGCWSHGTSAISTKTSTAACDSVRDRGKKRTTFAGPETAGK